MLSFFFRNKRSVFMTTAGEAFLSEAKSILEHYHKGMLKAKQAQKGNIGILKIGILREQFSEFFSQSIRLFKESYQDIEIEIYDYTNLDMITALKNHTIDIGFTISPGIVANEDLIWKSNMKLEMAVALPWRHPLAVQEPIDVRSLKNETLILYASETFAPVNDIFLQICAKNLVNLNIDKSASSVSGLMTLVECGKGIAIVPYHFKSQFNHRVHIVKLVGHTCSVERVFAWRKNNPNPCLPLFISKVL